VLGSDIFFLEPRSVTVTSVQAEVCGIDVVSVALAYHKRVGISEILINAVYLTNSRIHGGSIDLSDQVKPC
jgi:hypothetical protein